VKEHEVEDYFQWAVAMRGGMTIKTKAIGRRGFPDRIAFIPNEPMWLVELKAPLGRLSQHQKDFAADMLRLKQNYACLWTVEMVKSWAAQFKVFVL
jgi:hypothetical protein